MTTIDYIKREIKDFYENNKEVHFNISITHPKIELKNDPAKITGVYSNLFRVEEYSTGKPVTHTLKYTDILTKQIEIEEIKIQPNIEKR